MRNPRNIASFVLLGPSSFADYDIRVGQVARDVSQKFLIDLVMELKKSNARCLWIAKMVKEDKAKIPEIVIAKFPMFKTNGSWLQHDFAYTLENMYKLPFFSIFKTLETFAPAVAALACDHQILSPDDQVQAF
uniref:Uncharacterized protein n=1 Tax=Panagrolaimus superbus TaxID=310955 RepID=A0A914Z526_9BILA